MELRNVKSNKEIILLGHENIDVDSFMACIQLNKLFNYLNIKNKIVILDKKIEKSTEEVLAYAGYDAHDYMGEVDYDDEVFIVDHYEDSSKGQAKWCIDHHPNNKTGLDFEFYDNRRSSATAKIIYDYMVMYGYPITREDVFNTIVAIMTDTCSLKSTKCVYGDKIWVKDMVLKYGLDYDELYKLGLCLNDYDKTSVHDISLNGVKYYNYSGINIGASYIQNLQYPDDEKLNKYISYIQEHLVNNELKLWMFLVVDMGKDTCKEYHILKHSVKCINHPTILSRGQNIMPEIEKNIFSIINE